MLGFLLLIAPDNVALAQPAAPEWPVQVRALVEGGRLEQAMQVVHQWMEAYPEDLDARGWHARLQAWTRNWQAAEAEYRELLELAPHDLDLLLGLADLLTWQSRHEEALVLLQRACDADPPRSGCALRRARVLRQLGRTGEARAAYQSVLATDAGSAEARAGLAELEEADRHHELRLGADIDILNYAENAGALSASLRSRWNTRWSSHGSLTQYRRFGESATRFEANAFLRLTSKDGLAFGGAAARDQGVVPRAEAQVEYSHGFRLSDRGPFRGLEALYQNRWLWYRAADLTSLSPAAVFYLPRECMWLIRISATRIQFTGTVPEWKPSGWTRLTFPLRRRLRGQLLFAVGNENLGFVDQILQFSARTWGGGLTFRVAPGQELHALVQYQDRSRNQTQTSFGMSYVFRF